MFRELLGKISFVAILLLIENSPLCGFAPIRDKYDSEQAINDEFRAVYTDAQPKDFRVVSGTPTLKDLEDGEMVIVATGTFVRFMFRTNQEVYSINPSCVTVRR